MLCHAVLDYVVLLGLPPPPGVGRQTDPLRKFYSSLLQENANSAMARKW
jgi:hypothetical protein